MLLRRSTSTWSESLIWINPRRGYSRSMITYAVTDKTTAKATECNTFTTPNRHVVAREQRTGESQRAEQTKKIALSRISFNESRLIESKNATISPSSKTGVCEDSRTSLGGRARAAGLYSTTPRIKSESKSNR